jgi:hypothetical protein
VPNARLHEAFVAFDANMDRKLSATEFVQFLQHCAVRTVRQSCDLILGGARLMANIVHSQSLIHSVISHSIINLVFF